MTSSQRGTTSSATEAGYGSARTQPSGSASFGCSVRQEGSRSHVTQWREPSGRSWSLIVNSAIHGSVSASIPSAASEGSDVRCARPSGLR